MRWIKGIEAILGHVSVDETSCAVIQEDDYTSKQRTDYAVVHHQRKGKEQLQHPAQSDRRILDHTQQVEYHNHQDTPPFIVRSQPCSQPCRQQNGTTA